MQAYNQTPSTELRLSTAQPAMCNRLPCSAPQTLYSIKRQMASNQHSSQQSYVLWNNQTSRHVSSSANLQPRQMAEMGFSDSGTETSQTHSASVVAVLSNGHIAPLTTAQKVALNQNLNQHFSNQVLNRNSVPQQNCNEAPVNIVSTTTDSWFKSNYSNANITVNQINPTNQSVLPSNAQHNGMHFAQSQQDLLSGQTPAPQIILNNPGQTSGGHPNGASYSSVIHYPATSRLITLSHPYNYNHHRTSPSQSSSDGNQVQHSSPSQRQSSPYGMEKNSAAYSHLNYDRPHQKFTSKQQLPPSYAGQHFIIHNQNQRINQSAETSTTQDRVQPQASRQLCNNILQVSGHHTKASHSAVSAIQGNTQSQVLPLNHMTSGLQPVTGDSPTPILKEPTFNFRSCHTTSFTTQGPQPSHNSLNTSHPETTALGRRCSPSAARHSKELQRVSRYQAPVQRTAIFNENVPNSQVKSLHVQSSEAMQSKRLSPERESRQKHKRRHEVQYIEDVAETLELIKELQKIYQQSHKVVAVVPPIAQQAPSPDKENIATSPVDGPPFKIDAVDCADHNADIPPSKTGYTTPEGISCSTVLASDTPKGRSNCNVDGVQQSSVPLPEPEMEDLEKHEARSTVDRIVSNNPASNTCSATPENAGCDTVDLSKVRVRYFTLEKLEDLVKCLESKPVEGNMPVEGIMECLMKLYWDKSTDRVKKQIKVFQAEMSDFRAELSVEQMQTAKFQYINSEDLQMLACSDRLLKNDTISPAEEFKSSWLNVDGRPADIESVLAEPILDFPDYSIAAGSNNVLPGVHSEHESSTKVITEATDEQTVQRSTKELVSPLVGQMHSILDIVNTEDVSEKLEAENVAEPREQKEHLNSGSEGSKETFGTSAEKDQTECEQTCSDATVDISSPQRDLLNEDTFSSDSELMELSPISSVDAQMIFKKLSGSSLKKDPSQLCPDKRKVSATVDLGEFTGFLGSGPQIKFTCPHVTVVDAAGEHFCPKCWEETPILNLDLDESLVSPNEDSPTLTQGPQVPSCSPISDSIVSICFDSELKSTAASPNSESDVSEKCDLNPLVNLNLGTLIDLVERDNSPSDKSPVKEPHNHKHLRDLLTQRLNEVNGSAGQAPAKALSGTPPGKQAPGQLHSKYDADAVPNKNQTDEDLGLASTEFLQAPSLAQNTGKRKQKLRQKFSHPRHPPCKKATFTSTSVPATDASSPKSDDLNVIPTKGGRCLNSKERKGSSIILTIQRSLPVSGQSKTDAQRKSKTLFNNKKENGGAKQTGPKNEMKKQKFALYGSKKGAQNQMVSHACWHKSQLSEAPTYITILDKPDAAPSYNVLTSAKQKVYRQWSSTFVATKPNAPSSKKHQVKAVLESKMQALRRLVKERSDLKQKKLGDCKKSK